MPSAAEEIGAAIAAAPGGAIPFEQFMRLALYGAGGFYTRADAGGAGRRGDFLTSPEVGPLFGAVIARLVDAEWRRAGRPHPFHLVDLGAGAGTLLRSVAAASPECSDALRPVAVEPAVVQWGAHPDGATSLASIGDVAGGEPFDGVVIANELLDDVPFALAVHDGAWREAFVAQGDHGRFVEVLSQPFDAVPRVLPPVARHGARAPLQRGAGQLVTNVLDRLRSGALCAFDYCRASTLETAALDWRRWLRTYRGHQRAGHYLDDPGAVDITCDVMIDQLPTPGAVVDQAAFLASWGVDELVEEGRRHWQASAAAPTLDAMRMRSRVAEAEALLDPAGLGGFTVLQWRR